MSNPEYLINEQYSADRKSIESNNGIITQIDSSKKQMMNKKTNSEQLPYYIVFDLDKIENISWKKITHNISKKKTKKRRKNIKGLFFSTKK